VLRRPFGHFFQCFKASANLCRGSSSTHFPLRATKPPDDSRMARNSFSSSGLAVKCSR